jgi:Glycosyl hydrolases family 2, TIM barrel domain
MSSSFRTISIRMACLISIGGMLVGCREKTLARSTPPPTAIPVRVDAATGMARGGKPYFVKGAGGGGSLEQLAARGGNSVRTWDTNGLDAILDQAKNLGLTVSAGIWLEPESGWFSYQKTEHCDKQTERVRKQVMLHRGHPALLAWGLGNEVEGDGTNHAYWQQLDRLAKLVREIDPAHPTFTAIAGMNQAKAAGMDAHATHLDYVGINTYGAVFNLRKQLDKLGWKRPWMLTEWGPRGFWETPKTAYGAPLEQTSSEKSAMMRKAYQNVIASGDGCLGSYVFVWGWKFEATATWFGIFTHEGETTAAADTLHEMWSGTKPANQAPAIEDLRGVPKSSLAAGDTFHASIQATDPDADPLVWHWAVLPEIKGHNPGARPPMPEAVSGAIPRAAGYHVSVTAPNKPGIYRLHVWVKDGKGQVATANAPFQVR